jgi:hypothetical protein
MKTKITIISTVLAIVVAWNCSSLDPIAPEPASTGSADFTRFYVMGDNLTAGMQNGGLVEGFQRAVWGFVVARSAQATQFAFPSISEEGIPPTMYVSSYSPLEIDQLSEVGSPTNLAFPGFYNNMGIPGATVHQLLYKRADPATDTNPFFYIVLRDSTQLGGQATAVAQTAAAQPTFLIVWAGYSDIVGSASRGTDALLTPAASFETDYRAMMTALHASTDAIVAATIPDITDIPFFITIPPVVVDPATGEPVRDPDENLIPLIGYNQGVPGPLPLTSLVTLTAADSLAQRVGIPAALGGTGRPLPDWAVIDPTERDNILVRTAVLNAAIIVTCGDLGIPFVEMRNTFHDMLTDGYEMRGETYWIDYLEGGLYSVDGLHPSSLGYYVIALEFINVINEEFGAALKQPALPLGPFRDPALGATPPATAAATISTEEWNVLWRALGVEHPTR